MRTCNLSEESANSVMEYCCVGVATRRGRNSCRAPREAPPASSARNNILYVADRHSLLGVDDHGDTIWWPAATLGEVDRSMWRMWLAKGEESALNRS